MLTRIATFVLVLALGCRVNPRGPDTSIESVGEYTVTAQIPKTTLDSAIIALLIKIRAVDEAIDSLPRALRPDSGTAGADSTLLRYQSALQTKVRQVVATFDDSAFQILIWPEGARGHQLRRSQEQSGLTVAPIDPLASDSLRRILKTHGIWSYPAEGDTYFELSIEKLQDVAAPFVTGAAREALRIEALEQVSPTGGDASVSVSWDSLGDRLAATDRFLAAFPGAAARGAIEYRRGWYLRAFLTGWDNTAVFAHNTRILRPEVLASFERYVRSHQSTASAAIVQTYLELLAKSQYRRTPEVVDFLRTRSGILQHY